MKRILESRSLFIAIIIIIIMGFITGISKEISWERHTKLQKTIDSLQKEIISLKKPAVISEKESTSNVKYVYDWVDVCDSTTQGVYISSCIYHSGDRMIRPLGELNKELLIEIVGNGKKLQ